MFNDAVLLRLALRRLLKWVRIFPFCVAGEGTQSVHSLGSYGESLQYFLCFKICLFPFLILNRWVSVLHCKRFKKSQESFAQRKQQYVQDWSFLNFCEQVTIFPLTFHNAGCLSSAGVISPELGDENVSTFFFLLHQHMLDIVTGICYKVFLRKEILSTEQMSTSSGCEERRKEKCVVPFVELSSGY